jgi:nitrate/nitrite transport system substrate-binding protein
MIRWGQAPSDIDVKAASDRAYRTDIYRAAAREAGVACPDADRLPPGGHGEPISSPVHVQEKFHGQQVRAS